MRRMRMAFVRVETLQKAQIAQALELGREPITVGDRLVVMEALTGALADLSESVVMYLALCGLAPDEKVEPAVDEAEPA